jgi:hypothetical protein
MSSTRASRVLQGLVAAVFSTFVALLSHVAGGGAVPGLLGILTPLVLSLPVCVALAGRRLALARLSGSVVVSQLLFHSLFVLGASSGVVASSAGAHAGHSAHVAIATTGTAALAGASMWGAHAFAAVVTVAALHRGGVLMSRFSDIARFVATVVLRVALLLAPVRIVAVDAHIPDLIVAPRRAVHVVGAVSRRGPPLLSIA